MRLGGTARKSTGGRAPRKQLAGIANRRLGYVGEDAVAKIEEEEDERRRSRSDSKSGFEEDDDDPNNADDRPAKRVKKEEGGTGDEKDLKALVRALRVAEKELEAAQIKAKKAREALFKQLDAPTASSSNGGASAQASGSGSRQVQAGE